MGVVIPLQEVRVVGVKTIKIEEFVSNGIEVLVLNPVEVPPVATGFNETPGLLLVIIVL